MSLNRRQARWLLSGLLVIAAVPLFVNLGKLDIINVHEARVAATARNMLLNRPAELPDDPNPWIVPNFNGEARLKKTPLEYWVVAGSALVWGSVNEWSARVPSVLLGLFGIWLTYRLARQLTDRTTSILSAAVLATTFTFVIEARKAKVDIYLMALAALSIWLAMMAIRAKRKKLLYYTAFWIALGITFQAKYPMGPFLVLPIIGVYLIWQRQWSALFNWRHLPGVVLFVAICLGWFWAVDRLIHCGWGVWWDEVWLHTEAPGGERSQPWWFYLSHLFTVTFPWSVFMPPALALIFLKDFRSEVKHLALPFVWVCWIVLLYSLGAKKKADYLLPILPAMSILIAWLWGFLIKSTERGYRERLHRTLVGTSMGLMVILGISAAVLGFIWKATNPGLGIATGTLVAAAGIVGFWKFKSRRPVSSFVLGAAGAWIAITMVFAHYLPIFDKRISPAPFVDAVKAKVGQQTPLRFYRFRDDTVIYYWGKAIRQIAEDEFLQSETPVYAVTDREGIESLARHGASQEFEPFDTVIEWPNFRDSRVPGIEAFGKPGWTIYLVANRPGAKP